MKGGESKKVVPFIHIQQQQLNQPTTNDESNRQRISTVEDGKSFQAILNKNNSVQQNEEINKPTNSVEQENTSVEQTNNATNDEEQINLTTTQQIENWLSEHNHEQPLYNLIQEHALDEEIAQAINEEDIEGTLPLNVLEQPIHVEMAQEGSFVNGENELIEKVNNEEIVQTINEEMLQQAIPVIEFIRSILSNGDGNVENVKEIASRLLPIIEQWTSLKRQIGENELNEVLRQNVTEEQFNIWKFIEGNVDKRNQLTNHYRQDAQITRADLVNWLHAALERYSTIESKEPTNTQVSAITQSRVIPMSEVQQYTIHLQSLNKVERISQELTNRLINIIKESRFTTRPNMFQPMQQLTIVLKPEHLGNITVRLMQVDGNMTVNMIVTSQATKELLEANINQLKHMFLPHQVTIERDETISDEEFFKEHEEEKEQNKERNSDESNDSTNRERDENSDFEFGSLIEELVKGGEESA